MSYQTLQTLSQFVVALGILLTALGGFGAYVFGQKIQEEKEAIQRQEQANLAAQQAYAGKLEPERRLLLSGSQHVFPKLELGDSGSILMWAGPPGGPIFKMAEDNNITIEIEDSQVKVSTVIRDRNGHMVAQIIKNEWKVNPNNSWERNYSKDAVEVKAPSGDIVLQVRALEDRVQLQAKLYDSSGRGLALGKVRGPNGWNGSMETTDSNHPGLTMKIQPLFKYPSDLHLGQFLETRKHAQQKS